jgi:4-hydroxybenzoate polyprenyltransferase
MRIAGLTLAGLYTVRIAAGAAAAAILLSFWLLAFSIFIFLSLAFVKRYAELQVQRAHGKTEAHGRGYVVGDAPLVQTQGIAAGYAAVLVLALYIQGETVVQLYRTPELIWLAIPLILYWISWVWLQTHRGEMHEDPIVFAVRDRTSWVVAAGIAAVFVVAAVV